MHGYGHIDFKGGRCALQNEKLRRACGAAFWIQCMQYLFPQVKCKQNGTIPHSGARTFFLYMEVNISHAWCM
eukprot:COSAG05_NODE_4363_length_1549_cov_67.470267_1_plen_72_part_00